MGRIISCLITWIVIAGVNYGITLVSDLSFIDASVFIGLIGAAIIYFFSSTGGFNSRTADLQVQGQTGIKTEAAEKKFVPSYAFFASIVYLIAAGIATFFEYRDYFI